MKLINRILEFVSTSILWFVAIAFLVVLWNCLMLVVSTKAVVSLVIVAAIVAAFDMYMSWRR